MEKISVFIRHEAPGATETVEVTEAIARKLLDRWVRILHLEEWNINFQWKVRAKDMIGQDCIGCTSANVVSRQAIIQMIDPVDFENPDFPYDYEKTLVHELLHLTFWDMDDTGDDLRDKLIHIMVDRMARALVTAERSVLDC